MFGNLGAKWKSFLCSRVRLLLLQLFCKRNTFFHFARVCALWIHIFSAFLLNFIIGDTNFHKFIHCLFEYNILFSLSVFTETYYMWSAGNCCVFRKTHTYTSNSIDLNRRSEQKKQQNKNITLRLHWQPWNRVKHRQSDFYVHRIVRFRIELPNKICTPYE